MRCNYGGTSGGQGKINPLISLRTAIKAGGMHGYLIKY
jgi:hypothetical protein